MGWERAAETTWRLVGRDASAGRVARSSPREYFDEFLTYGQPPSDSSEFSRGPDGYIHARISAPLCGDHILPLPAARPRACVRIGGREGDRGVGWFHVC